MFGEDNEPEGGKLNPMIASILEAGALGAKHAKQIDEFSKKHSETAENGFLMDFWKYLGDHTETYTLAMRMAGAFDRIEKMIQEEYSKFPPENRIAFAKVLLAAAEHRVGFCEELYKLEAQMERDHEALKNPSK